MNFSPYQPPPDAQREQQQQQQQQSSGSNSFISSGKGKSRQPVGSSVGAGTSAVGRLGGSKVKRPWFSRDASSFQGAGVGTGAGSSYQSGGDPSRSYTDAYAYDPSSLDAPTGSGSSSSALYNSSSAAAGAGNPNNVWEARIGWVRVDVLAGMAYLGGPLAAVLLLIFETTNDYVRFHAYQSGLLTTPIIVLWLFMTLVGVWRWLRRLYLFTSTLVVLYTAYRAFRDPTALSGNTSSRGGGGAGGLLTTGFLPRFYLPVIGDLAERWVGEE